VKQGSYGIERGKLMGFSSFLSYDEIENWIGNYIHCHREIAYIESIGQSDEGRAIKAVHVTNNSLPMDEKEIALIIVGRHGDEVGTRVVGPAVLEWLASRDAQEIRDRQHVIVIPIANPDGCIHEVFGAPATHLSDIEKSALLPLGARYIPEIVMDVHSVGKEKRGLNWGGLEAVIIDQNATEGEDQYILGEMARGMLRAAAREGYPFLLHTLEPYGNLKKKAEALAGYSFNNHVNRALYDAFHPLTFGMEVNHFVLRPDETARSGLAVIKSMLEMGSRVFPWEYHPGYPNRILSGDFLAWIGPRGRNAHARRASRKEIWSKRHFFRVPFAPYREMMDRHSVRITVRYAGEEEITNGITIGFRIRGLPRIRSITVNGEHRDYYVKRDECSTYVFVDLEAIKQDDMREVVARF
jgi:hypothetical protein